MRGLIVKTEIAEVQNALSGTKKSLTSISKQALGVIAKGTVKTVKNEIRALTTKRTGELLKAYRYKVTKDGSQAKVFPKALAGNKSIYPKVMALSYGRKKDGLKALGFVQKGQDYVEKGSYETELQKLIDKELSKYWS